MSKRYLAYFLAMAGLAGVLYGLGANGEMSIAKPYMEATTGFDATRLSLLVGGCLLGSVCVNFFAGALSDWFGRKRNPDNFPLKTANISAYLFKRISSFTS